MVVPMYNAGGEKIGEVELTAGIFEVPVNIPLMHQALEFQLANARAGTHKAKSRGEINRTKMKWYRQKGTGRARHGSRNAPIFVGGGILMGRHPVLTLSSCRAKCAGRQFVQHSQPKLAMVN